ncbi:hypothetical protein [Streptomyces bathyalis]|uniref:hypothetical protein n=1 Tax=Streptomyces bathyalis TaxID=2710756 RepID=UPI001FE9585E|nr:hypothetical protein [Streptomyces bathyalis]
MTTIPKIEEVLQRLKQNVSVAVHSTRGLVGKVGEAAADKERERQETFQKRQEEGKTKPGDTYVPLRRKPGLRPLPSQELGLSVQLTFWDILHRLGRGLALSQRGASRGLAEHWGSLKYCQALSATTGTRLELSEEGKRIAMYYKALQSEELGHAFALAISEAILTRRYPNHSISIVRADTALRAGWTLTGRDKEKTQTVGYQYRPQFFAEVWKPGESSRVFPIACKGNHSDQQKACEQLASAAVHVDGVHIGAWNQTPALLFSTEISLSDPLTVHVLHADGPGGWLHIPDCTPAADIGLPAGNRNPAIGILKPAEGKEPDTAEPGCQVNPDDYSWFQRILARVGAAGLTAFAGDGESTAALLTKRQGSDFFQSFAHAASGSVQDAHYTLLGEKFEGTDHVFRLNGERVQAFSGVAKDILDAVVTRKEEERYADVAAYRQQVHAWRTKSHGTFWDRKWDGVVSISRDGTVLAMRQIPPFRDE